MNEKSAMWNEILNEITQGENEWMNEKLATEEWNIEWNTCHRGIKQSWVENEKSTVNHWKNLMKGNQTGNEITAMNEWKIFFHSFMVHDQDFLWQLPHLHHAIGSYQSHTTAVYYNQKLARDCYDFRWLRQSSTVVVSKVWSQMSLEECKSWTCIVLLGLRVKVQVERLSIKD